MRWDDDIKEQAIAARCWADRSAVDAWADLLQEDRNAQRIEREQ